MMMMRIVRCLMMTMRVNKQGRSTIFFTRKSTGLGMKNRFSYLGRMYCSRHTGRESDRHRIVGGKKHRVL
jgi:hypothetical protein